MIAQSFGRLHFGLMEICPGEPHCFGGLGLMLDQPVSTIEFDVGVSTIDSIHIQANAYWTSRIRKIIEHWLQHRQTTVCPVTSIRGTSLPMPHQGLGSGTQIACTVANILHYASCKTDIDAHIVDNLISIPTNRIWESFGGIHGLADASGRGKRSYIGLTGFLSGGLIVDRGQTVDDTQPRTNSHRVPESWRWVLVCDTSSAGDSGTTEAQLFEQCATYVNPNRERMLNLIEADFIPAIENDNWIDASKALGTYGELAGELFRPVQGGIYRSSTIAEAVAMLRELGLQGSGQSSWGPTVFGLAKDPDHAQWCVDQIQDRASDTSVRIVATARDCASITVSSQPEA